MKALDFSKEAKRVQRKIPLFEVGFSVLRDVFGGENPLIRGLSEIVTLFDLGSVSRFLDEFQGGLKEVLIEPESVIESGQLSAGSFPFVAEIADGLSHDVPVLLFDVTLIVLSIRTTAREGDLTLPTVPQQVGVDEFAAVVAVQAQKGKGETRTHSLDGGRDLELTLVEESDALGPPGGDIGEGQAVKELALDALATMSHEVDF